MGLDAGKYAEFNPLDLLLWYYHGGYTNQTENQWIPNFVNTSSLYDTLYGWQGQVLSLHITNSTGAALPNQPVWLGTYDAGHEYKFERYAPTARDPRDHQQLQHRWRDRPEREHHAPDPRQRERHELLRRARVGPRSGSPPWR